MPPTFLAQINRFATLGALTRERHEMAIVSRATCTVEDFNDQDPTIPLICAASVYSADSILSALGLSFESAVRGAAPGVLLPQSPDVPLRSAWGAPFPVAVDTI
jgi:hypothetical protein